MTTAILWLLIGVALFVGITWLILLAAHFAGWLAGRR